jgi:DNA-binding NtrC family response regulator
VFDFCANPCATTIFLRGPIGAGKSTVARTIGFLKRIAPLTDDQVERHIRDLRYDGPNRIDIKLMPWYVELPLTGLVESLAESQLFGIGRGKATGVLEGAGVFERATKGQGIRDEAGSRVTGGVVFLDEIAELSQSLQAKLLPVLSGGVFYRVGTEGDRAVLMYQGVTIAASWRRLDGVVRPDLLSRLSAYVIDVPGIDDRREDFPILVDSIQQTLLQEFRDRVERLEKADPGVDLAYWRKRRDLMKTLDDARLEMLAAAPWARLGNLRGLTAALNRALIGGEDPRRVLDTLPTISEDRVLGAPDPGVLLARLLARTPGGSGLAAHVREVELEGRRQLRTLLSEEPATRAALARVLDIPDEKLAVQVQQLDRQRIRGARKRRA